MKSCLVVIEALDQFMFLLEGYKSWSGTFAWTTTGSTKTTTYTYTVIRQDDTTFNFDTVVEKEMEPPTDSAEQLEAAAALGPLNAKMLQFVTDNYGRKIGNGQCYDAAAEPLAAIGAKAPDGTKFGLEVSLSLVLAQMIDAWLTVCVSQVSLEEMGPGDVIQFKWCRWKGDLPNGKGNYTMYAGDEASNGAHTAVCHSVQDGGKVFIALEQNIGGALAVSHRSYRMGDMYEGEIKAYRPQEP